MEKIKKFIVSNKILIAIISVALVLCIFFLVFFLKESKEEVKKTSKSDNYVLKFSDESDGVKVSEEVYTFKNGKVSSVKVIKYFENKETANLLKDYYDEEESSKSMFSSISVKDNSIILVYSNAQAAVYSDYSRNELISLKESEGLVYEK